MFVLANLPRYPVCLPRSAHQVLTGRLGRRGRVDGRSAASGTLGPTRGRRSHPAAGHVRRGPRTGYRPKDFREKELGDDGKGLSQYPRRGFRFAPLKGRRRLPLRLPRTTSVALGLFGRTPPPLVAASIHPAQRLGQSLPCSSSPRSGWRCSDEPRSGRPGGRPSGCSPSHRVNIRWGDTSVAACCATRLRSSHLSRAGGRLRAPRRDLGFIVGLASGYFGGILDEVMMRLMDVLFAFPTILLGLLAAVLMAPGVPGVVVTIVVATIPVFGRVVRGPTLSVRATEYTVAARHRSASSARILWRYVLPNVSSAPGPENRLHALGCADRRKRAQFSRSGRPAANRRWGPSCAMARTTWRSLRGRCSSRA